MEGPIGQINVRPDVFNYFHSRACLVPIRDMASNAPATHRKRLWNLIEAGFEIVAFQ